MNIDTKILSKMLANWIQYVKKIYVMTKEILSQECKAGLEFKKINVIYNYRLKEKKHIAIVMDENKMLWQNSTSIHKKNSQQTKKRGRLPQSDERHLYKS